MVLTFSTEKLVWWLYQMEKKLNLRICLLISMNYTHARNRRTDGHCTTAVLCIASPGKKLLHRLESIIQLTHRLLFNMHYITAHKIMGFYKL